MSKPNVVLLIPDTPRRSEVWTDEAAARAEELGMNTYFAGTPFTPEAVRGADAAITTWGSPKFDRRWLDAADRLQIIGHAAGSVQRIVTPEFFASGIPIVSGNAVMADCVAQWSLMMTMMAARRMITYCNFGDHRHLKWNPPLGIIGAHRLTVGIWGYGEIARALIRMLRSIGIKKIRIVSSYLSTEEAEKLELEKVSLEELFVSSDIVHLLTSLNENTLNRIDSAMLAKMKNGASLINTGRAHLIQHDAFMNELRSGRIFAYLDVYYQEPLPADDELRMFPNVVLTPHNAGSGTRDLLALTVLDDIDRKFKQLPLRHEMTESRAAVMTVEYKQLTAV